MNNLIVEKILVSETETLRKCMTVMEQTGKGIALVIDPEHRLLGVITDGDIRRAILAGLDLLAPVNEIIIRKAQSSNPTPLTALVGTPQSILIQIMQQNVLRQIPLLDDDGKVVDLAYIDDLLPKQDLHLDAVVMAGGQSARLSPLVDDLPKPMLPVGNKPLLELTISNLSNAGIRNVNLITHYKAENISSYFGDGKKFGVEVKYTQEEQPLGTAGALSLLGISGQPILVMNGDILTRVDFKAMFDFHNDQGADMTIAVRKYEFKIPYGVIEMVGVKVKEISEKPNLQRFINAGIYLLKPDVLKYIPVGQPYDMPDLINRLIHDGRRVVSFPVHEYWLDIEQFQDYKQAVIDVNKGAFNEISTLITSSEPGVPTLPGVISLSVPEIRGNEWAYIKECLDTNWVSSVGPFVDSFERMVASYVGTQYGIATSNGTSALHIALLVAGIQPGDEVIIPSLTFIAPANAIRYTGAWPVIIDIEPDYWQIDPQKIANFLNEHCEWREGTLYNKHTTRRIKAVMPVHILGHPCDMDPIINLAKRFNLSVIEDASESLGAKYRGRMVGHLGDIACFSFNGNKVITTGGGGMIVTDNEAWALKAKYLTTQAKDDPLEFVHGEIGYNYRLNNIQAAMGCAQMEQLAQFIAIKRKIASNYAEGLKDVQGISLMNEASWAQSTFWLYTVLVDKQRYGLSSRELMKKLAQAKIQTRPLWQPMHISPAQKGAFFTSCETTEKVNQSALSLPCSIGLEQDEQNRVIDTIRNSYNERK